MKPSITERAVYLVEAAIRDVMRACGQEASADDGIYLAFGRTLTASEMIRDLLLALNLLKTGELSRGADRISNGAHDVDGLRKNFRCGAGRLLIASRALEEAGRLLRQLKPR